jgi:glycosyltransferase involved in cell wall biosynthesis
MCTYIAHLIDSEQIDLIHCTMQFSLLMGWVARRRAKRKPPLVCAIHITRNKDMKTELQDRLLYHWLLLACDKLIFVCETQRMHWISKFSGLADKAEVVHNGVDLDYFNAQAFNIERTSFRKRHRIADDAVVFCCIAGFRSEKGHLILLQSFAKVLAAFPNACMVLAGDGPTRQAAHEYAGRHGIAKHVVFTGNVSDVHRISKS